MIIISARKDFDDPERLAEDHQIKEIDLTKEKKSGSPIKITKNEVSEKNILILIHGYNNERDEVYDAYQIIEKNINSHIPNRYDMIVGYSWPGGDDWHDWWKSKSRANGVARKFRFLLESLHGLNASVDLMSHSLGARVCLKALKETDANDALVKNYYCMAPAVDNECLEPDEEFHDALNACERLFVFHSARDKVLKVSYFMAEWDRALGL